MEEKERLSRAVTVSDIKTAVGFVAVIATVIFFGAQLQSDSAQTKNDIGDLKSNVKELTNKQDLMALDVTKVKTIIEGAQARGQITLVPQRDYLSMATPNISAVESPTPTPAIQQVSYNATYTAAPTPEPTKKVEPAPAPPTPTPTRVAGIGTCVLNICL